MLTQLMAFKKLKAFSIAQVCKLRKRREERRNQLATLYRNTLQPHTCLGESASSILLAILRFPNATTSWQIYNRNDTAYTLFIFSHDHGPFILVEILVA